MNAASWLEGLPAERWRARLLAEGPRVATWVLGLALGVQAALIATDLVSAGRTPRPTASAPSSPFQPGSARAHARTQALDPAAIASAHLFGAAPASARDGANAPQTSIPLVLTGTIAGNDPQNGLAILGQSAQTAKIHAVGDTVPGGAKLHSVYSDRVIIDRNGQLESLTLPHQSAGGAPPPSAGVLPANSSIERMRKMITEQPGLLTDVLRPQPVFDHGKMNGFRIFPGRDRAEFMRLGLRPGDQVIAINGTPLDDRDNGEQILGTLGNSAEARLTIVRAGQQQELNLNIAQVAQEADSLAQQPPSPAQSAAVQSPGPPPAALETAEQRAARGEETGARGHP